jgi:hypothetical protein
MDYIEGWASEWVDVESYEEDGLLVCPVCKHGYTHLDSVRVVTANEGFHVRASGEDEAASVSVIPVPSENVGRRHAIIIEGQCEAGHSFEIRFRQHKGWTFVTTVISRWVRR